VSTQTGLIRESGEKITKERERERTKPGEDVLENRKSKQKSIELINVCETGIEEVIGNTVKLLNKLLNNSEGGYIKINY